MSRNRSGYLPSLDGWRCVAILGVLWAHDDSFAALVGPAAARNRLIGGFGVALFYAISGFLIAWRILQEERKTGHFSLGSFYLRRFFRIQPPQWAFLAVVGCMMLGGVVHITLRYWLGAFFLYENFLWHNLNDVSEVIAHSFLVGHFWTLAVEEHFYLLISLFFFLVKRRRASFLGAGLLVLVAAQHWAQHHGYYSEDVSSRRTYWNIQWLLFASVAALSLQEQRVRAGCERWLRPWMVFAATACLVYAHQRLIFGNIPATLYDLVFQNGELLSFCFTAWVAATVLHPSSLTTRFLELRPLRFVGRISYSLYIWHVLFYLLRSPAACEWPLLVRLNGAPWKYPCTLAVAVLSYYVIERPTIRLGHKLAHTPLPSRDPSSGLQPLTES